jgi:hypothetical protein
MSATTMNRAPSRWHSVKPNLMYLVIGLIAGPLITGIAGWQVLSGTARDQVRAEVIEQQATFCAFKARAEVAGTSNLGNSVRYELAAKWAVMPGATKADSEVAQACKRKLKG